MLETRCAIESAAVPSFLVAVILLAQAVLAEAQQAEKMARIGYLSSYSGSTGVGGIGIGIVPFKEGLRELGWVEGKQVKFEYRYAGRQFDKVSEFATELVRL